MADWHTDGTKPVPDPLGLRADLEADLTRLRSENEEQAKAIRDAFSILNNPWLHHPVARSRAKLKLRSALTPPPAEEKDQ